MIYQTTNTKQNQSLKSPSTPLKTDPKTQATPAQHPSKKIDTSSRYIPPSTPTSTSPISISISPHHPNHLHLLPNHKNHPPALHLLHIPKLSDPNHPTQLAQS